MKELPIEHEIKEFIRSKINEGLENPEKMAENIFKNLKNQLKIFSRRLFGDVSNLVAGRPLSLLLQSANIVVGPGDSSPRKLRKEQIQPCQNQLRYRKRHVGRNGNCPFFPANRSKHYSTENLSRW